MIEQLETEQQRLEKLIEENINKHDKLRENKALLESIPAVGNVIALMVICSRQFDDAHQCAAYLGLVPVQHESGSSVKGRAHLSKAGNPIIRAKLYMAAVVTLSPAINYRNTALYPFLLASSLSML
jgi:transposase